MSLIPVRQSEALRRVLESYGLDLHTAMPGMIRSYDPETQTADILIGVRRVNPGQGDDDPDETEVFPILPAVPVLWPFTAKFFLHLPISVGDGVLLVFCEADINAWRGGRGVDVDPGVATRFGLSGAVAIPGLSWRDRTFTPSNALTGDFERGGAEFGCVSDGPRIMVTSQDVQAGGTHALALKTQTDAQLAALAADMATVFAAAMAGTPTITTIRAANPIGTTTLKGA